MNQIFDIDINIMENVDLVIIEEIEEKCKNGKSLTKDEALYFLSYISYKVRDLLIKSKHENIDGYNFSGDCTNAQSMLKHYFDDLNLKSIPVQTNRIFFNVLQHSFIIVYLLEEDKLVPYLVDPTYNQFFDVDKCLTSKYVIKDGIIKWTPDPGYFILKENDANQEVIKKFLKYGFMELTRDNAIIYGDSFYFTQTGLSKKVYDTLSSINGLYLKFFLNSNFEISKSKNNLKSNGLLLEPIKDSKKTNNKTV
ncbi:MAG: hypothetical protein IKG27_04535 [Bacilli bacterium]|nr:hypothetical protein [Bacilli bacterium]